jgi:hypothetical protein
MRKVVVVVVVRGRGGGDGNDGGGWWKWQWWWWLLQGEVVVRGGEVVMEPIQIGPAKTVSRGL